MKVLNLYSGIGGNRKLWKDVEVTAVENNEEIAGIYQDFFPDDKVIVEDAHQYLLDQYKEFDFIWSSPPCQSHSRMNKATRHDLKRYPDMQLYQEIIFMQEFYSGKWVVENVKPYYKPLIEAQDVGRHYFWANFLIPDFSLKQPKDFIVQGNLEGKKALMDWLGMHFEKNVYLGGNHCPGQILRNCVHPKLGLHVFECAFKKKQLTLDEVD